MKTELKANRHQHTASGGSRWGRLAVIAMLVGAGATAWADGTNSPLTPEQLFEGGTNSYKNWVTLSVGGVATSGNAAEAEQSLHLNRGAFGGIEDLHLKNTVATNTTLTIDGHSIFDNHDYQLEMNLKKDNFGFVRFNFQNFRTWYNDAGAYYPPLDKQYSGSSDALSLDRGEIDVAAGYTKYGVPNVTFKYSHRYRDGEKGSTIWGPVHPFSTAQVVGVAPSFYNIDEKVDSFELNATHHIKATHFGLGLDYEVGDLNDSLNTISWQGEPVQRKVTDRQGTTYGMFSVHAFTETWIKNNLFLSTGYLFDNLDNDFSGSRIYGDDYNVGYTPDWLNGLGYYNLDGSSHLQQYVLNLNLLYRPRKTLTIVPSIRVQKEDSDANSAGVGTLGTSSSPFNAQSTRSMLDVTEGLHLRYTGVTNWVFFARGEWTEGNGSLYETNGLTQVHNIGVAPVLQKTDDRRFFQKYSVGARWYPLYGLTVNAVGYYKNHRYDYNNILDSTPNGPNSYNRYPAYLVMQGFETYDGNLSVNCRLLQNLSLISRYEYQRSTIHTRPDPVSGLNEVESSEMTSHILAEDISWIPWSRLSLQAGFNYVLSDTKTPASGAGAAALDSQMPGYTQALLDAQNNYWTVNCSAGLVLDNQTELNLSYFYYQADNYANNSSVALPLGAGAHEHGVTATLTHEITQNMRWNLRYGYYNYADDTSGGYNNFEANVVSSSFEYRF